MRAGLGLIGILVVLVIIVIAANSSNNNDTSSVGDPNVPTLTDYARAGSYVELFNDGEINSESEHRSIRIRVSENQTSVAIIKGYQETVIDRKQFKNNVDSYMEFLSALEVAGFSSVNDKPNYDKPDGVCPSGRRLSLILSQDGEEKQNLFLTSCSRRDGTSGASSSAIERLFQDQVPEYREFVRDVDLT